MHSMQSTPYHQKVLEQQLPPETSAGAQIAAAATRTRLKGNQVAHLHRAMNKIPTCFHTRQHEGFQAKASISLQHLGQSVEHKCDLDMQNGQREQATALDSRVQDTSNRTQMPCEKANRQSASCRQKLEPGQRPSTITSNMP